MRGSILFVCAALLLLQGCGGGGGGNNNVNPVKTAISVSITPGSGSTQLNGTQQFAATVTNSANQAVNWSVVEGAAGGTVSATGLYAAPMNVAGVFHIKATSQVDNVTNAVVPVTVHLNVSVSPPSATVALGQHQQFMSTITGSADTAVVWSEKEGAAGGSVSATGVYLAPTNAAGTFHVVAKSSADSTETATATVIVQAGSASYNPFLYDGFAYPAGSAVAGLNGGTGDWGGAWNEYGQGETPSVISSGGLTFNNLVTAGNAILTTSDFPVGHARPFSTSPGKVGTVLWISYLVEPVGSLTAGYPSSYFQLVYGGVAIGMPGNSGYYGMEHSPGGGDSVLSSTPVVMGQTAFLVVRITFGPVNGNDTIDLFVNPPPGQQPPAVPSATKTDANTGEPTDFNFGSSIKTMFDEIRFGHNYVDVAPAQ